MNIGKNIYELRRAKKWTQGQLAEKLGVSEQAVSKWENDVCAPDVSLLPLIAGLFGVSIDRLFGFRMADNQEEVSKIMENADRSMDTHKEIDILTEGLTRFPNSNRLKNYLAFSYSMLHRIAETEEERMLAAKKALRLCDEVVATSGDARQIDSAVITMSRVHMETGDDQAAMQDIQKMSADNYFGRIVYTASLLGSRHDVAGQLTFVEESLFHCWLAMCQSVEGLIHSLMFETVDLPRALAFQTLHIRLLELFDSGFAEELQQEGQRFYATAKMFAYERRAEIHMKLGEQDSCVAELERFFDMAGAVRAVAKSNTFFLSARNAYFAEAIDEALQEEYMSEVFPERVLGKYEAFLAENARFEGLKRRALIS